MLHMDEWERWGKGQPHLLTLCPPPRICALQKEGDSTRQSCCSHPFVLWVLVTLFKDVNLGAHDMKALPEGSLTEETLTPLLCNLFFIVLFLFTNCSLPSIVFSVSPFKTRSTLMTDWQTCWVFFYSRCCSCIFAVGYVEFFFSTFV